MKCFKCKNIIKSDAIYGLHQDCFIAWFDLPAHIGFRNIDPKRSSASSHPDQIPRSKIKKKDTFFHGRYLKYSATLGDTSYILKIQEDKYPELPAVEYLCNEIALLLDIDVPDFFLIDYENRTTFLARNFMQDYTGTLHHIYKYLPAGEEKHNCEEIIKVISNETGRLSEVTKFIKICLFDALTGNNDRHGRNIGIIETATSKILAPMYDNPCFLGIEEVFMLEAEFNPSGSIWTKETKEPKIIHYISEFNRLGYEKIVAQFSKKALAEADKIILAVKDSILTDKRKLAFIKLFKSRIEDLKDVK